MKGKNENIENELRDELKILKEKFSTAKSIEELSKKSFCSVATLYNYFGGKVSNINTAKSIIENANLILSSNG